MLNNKLYSCDFCNTKPVQLSHHKAHIETLKHLDKKELFELKIAKLSEDELKKEYNTLNINDIVEIKETIVYDSKKLNNLYNTPEELVNLEILTKHMSEQYVVSNKEALRDKIHDIHNFLRNNGAGYGMSALKIFNIFYGLKKIEEKKLLDKVNLEKECKFSYLFDLAKENKDEKLSETIYGKVLDSIAKSTIGGLLFYEIPKHLKSSTFNYLIKEIDSITQIEKKCNVLLSGKIYEYFIGRDESAISELGAYFTDRHIVDYIYDKVKPKLNDDKTVKTMCDMFGGSGGFTTGYIDYLVNNYDDIDWKKEMNKIYHFDMNEDVIKSAGLEFFCLTGVIPNIENHDNDKEKKDLLNIACKNSFADEFDNTKFDYIFTNPPYGGDKSKQSDSQIKRNKVKDYIKEELKTLKDKEKIKHRTVQLKAIDNLEKQDKKDNDKRKVSIETSSARIQKFAKDNKLSGNDKESVSLMLMMDMIKQNGVCVGVLKEGVFFNSVYKDLRKKLIENYNVKEVVSVPKDQFENTSTKTSIVIFENTKEKTKTIKFSELSVERYETDIFEEKGDKILLVENKGDIKKVIDKQISVASLEELKEKKYSLNGKDYNNVLCYCPVGFELKKLGDLLEYKNKSKKRASEGKEEGKYKFYTSSDKIKYCDFVDYDDDLCLVLGNGGTGSLFLDDTFSCSDHNFVMSNKNKITTEYIYNYLKCIWDNFTKKLLNGSTLANISKENLNNYQIPIPKDMSKMKPLITKLHDTHMELTKLREEISEKEKEVQNRIQEICDTEECDEYKLGDVCKVYGTPGGSKLGKFERYTNIDNNKYGFLRGADISNNLKQPLYYISKLVHEKYYEKSSNTVKKNDILLTACSQKLNFTKVPKEWNNYAYHGCIKFSNIEKISTNYLISYMNSDIFTKNILAMQSGSVVQYSNASTFTKSIIKIPKSKTSMKDLEKEFERIDELKTKLENTEKQYEEYQIVFKKHFENPEEKKVDKKQKEDSESSLNKKTLIKKKSTKKKHKKEESESDSNSESSSESESDSNSESSSESESDSSSESSSESETEEYVWDISVLSKMKKYKDDKDKLKDIMKKNKIPENIFKEKIKVIQKKK
jgi:type I restriction enzyme, S subunit